MRDLEQEEYLKCFVNNKKLTGKLASNWNSFAIRFGSDITDSERKTIQFTQSKDEEKLIQVFDLLYHSNYISIDSVVTKIKQSL